MKKVNASGLPFDDATYAHMKYVIEKITGKLRTDISLSPEELIRFNESVEEIIADAYGDEEIKHGVYSVMREYFC